MKKSFAVVGLGRFGTNVALTLMESGAQVLAIDSTLLSLLSAVSDFLCFKDIPAAVVSAPHIPNKAVLVTVLLIFPLSFLETFLSSALYFFLGSADITIAVSNAAPDIIAAIAILLLSFILFTRGII